MGTSVKNESELKDKALASLSLITEVASKYYVQGKTQEEIAKELYLSRTKISRLLKRAQQEGIVQIRINYLLQRDYMMEERIQRQFKLKNVWIFDDRGEKEDPQQGVIRLAAEYLSQRISKNRIVGVSWGNTLSKTVELINPKNPKPIHVVEIMGAAAATNHVSSGTNIAAKLAAKFGGDVNTMNVPLFVDEGVTEILENNPLVKNTLTLAKNVDLLISSLGTLNAFSRTNPWKGFITDTMMEELKKKNAVGCIGARFYNPEGQMIDTGWNRSCIGIQISDIRRIPETVVIINDNWKAEALKAALHGEFIDTLITNRSTAEEIIL